MTDLRAPLTTVIRGRIMTCSKAMAAVGERSVQSVLAVLRVGLLTFHPSVTLASRLMTSQGR